VIYLEILLQHMSGVNENNHVSFTHNSRSPVSGSNMREYCLNNTLPLLRHTSIDHSNFVAATGRIRTAASSAVYFHSGSRQEVQISCGLRWGRQGLSHHSQCWQPHSASHLAGRQPHNPSRGHVHCNGSRSASNCRLQVAPRYCVLAGADGGDDL
jgi:hypothetical protein